MSSGPRGGVQPLTFHEVELGKREMKEGGKTKDESSLENRIKELRKGG
jgi:hypothetical protein